MCVTLVAGPVAGRVALRSRDGDHAGLAAQQPAGLAPLRVGGMLGSVVPTALATCAAALTRHHYRTIIHRATLLHAAAALHESVLQFNRRTSIRY